MAGAGRRRGRVLSVPPAAVRALILGLGYSGRAIASALRRAGVAEILATQREPAGPDETARILPFDGAAASAALLAALAGASHVVVAIPPGEDGDPALAALGPALRASPQLRWLGYLSTVGVYGDHAGRWIDETAACAPANARSRQRLAAEAGWQALAAERGIPLAIFRLAGIYGPGRSPLDNLRAGTAHRVVKPGQVFNRIHVDDLADAVTAALLRQAAGIFNVADNEPAPPQDVVAYAAGLLGLAPPPEVPFAAAALSPMARSFYGENKRVRNDRIKSALGVTLAYPTFREGLAALAKQERS